MRPFVIRAGMAGTTDRSARSANVAAPCGVPARMSRGCVSRDTGLSRLAERDTKIAPWARWRRPEAIRSGRLRAIRSG